jgi:hypothetical protein
MNYAHNAGLQGMQLHAQIVVKVKEAGIVALVISAR